MQKKLVVFGAVVIAGLTGSCWGGSGVKIPSPDREAALLADDKINEVDVYSEPEHLKIRLYESGGPERDIAAERLALLNTRKARKIISQVLKGDNEEAAKSVLKALAKHKSDYLFIDEMISILETGKASLHHYVFAVFSNSDEEKISKAILKELNQPEKPEPVRQNLVKGLSFVPSIRSIPFLIGLLSNRKSDINAEIINTLNTLTRKSFPTREEWIVWWKANSSQSREKWLEQSLIEYKSQIQEKDKLIKQSSDTITALKIDILKMRLEQARRLVDPTAEIALLTSALDDKAIMLKKYALEQIKILDKEKIKQVLPRLRDELTAYPLGKPVQTESSVEEYRILLIDIMGDLGDEASIDPLLSILNNFKESAAIKNKITVALRRIKNPKVVLPLIQLLDRESPEIVVVIVETLGTFGLEGKPAVAKLHECLKSTIYQNDEKLIKSVIDALGDIKDPSSAPEILPFINDTRPRVRWSASNCLGKINVPDIAPQLAKLLADEFMDIRQITIESLGKLGNKAAGPDIIKILLNDKDTRTRQLSAEALGKIKDAAGIPALIIILNEKDEKLAGSAWTALLSITADNLDLMENAVSKLRELKLTSYAIKMLKDIANNQQFKAEEFKTRISLDKGVLGLLLMESGEYDKAEVYLQDAVKNFADKPEFTLALISCYKKLQKFDQALKSCTVLLEDQKESSPEWWSVKLEQFSLYSELKEYNKVIEETGKLISRNNLTPEIKEKLEKAKDEAQKMLSSPAPANPK